MKSLVSLLALTAACLVSTTAEAQVVTYYRPALVPRTVYYAPAPVVSTPVVAAPAPVVVQRPVVVAQPAPVRTVTYYAPTVVEPVATPVVYEPTVRVRQRYRPILGGTVTRVDHGYTRSVYPIVRY
ncbi:MAG: hypothetical protein RH917_20135 [Lacipirellulaceae bacterium]